MIYIAKDNRTKAEFKTEKLITKYGGQELKRNSYLKKKLHFLLIKR